MRQSTLITAIAAAAFAFSAWVGASAPADAAEISFDLKEKTIIADFYGGSGGGNQGQGKGKKNKGKGQGGGGQGVGAQGMPPGLAMNGRMPPGIAKRQLPSGLISQLPPPPKGFERVIVDNDVLLVNIATKIIHDVLTDVIKK